MAHTESLLWSPSEDSMRSSRMWDFMRRLEAQSHPAFNDYASLYEWSVADIDAFWGRLAEYFEFRFHRKPDAVRESPATGMIGTCWFPGSTLSYAEHVFRHRSADRPAIVYGSEDMPVREMGWEELEGKVARVAAWLRRCGVTPGDRVASLLPNTPEAVVAFLAANSIGAVWSSCSPDFGQAGIIDRFAQIEPRVIFLPDAYRYNGKEHDRMQVWQEVLDALPSLRQTVVVSHTADPSIPAGMTDWNEPMAMDPEPLSFEAVPFDHPIWILYSSGTTGKPKAITHSTGGCLIEHLKALVLHQDVRPGDRYFWYSTTGWMMWNYAVGSLLAGATLVLYDGAPAHPDLQVLWTFAQQTGIHHFGSGAAFYISCMKAGLSFPPNAFPMLRTIGSTGSPLPPEAFRWVYSSVKSDVWLVSISGGTDVCSAFVGGCPLLPVHAGEIQCRLLGCDLESFDEAGRQVRDSVGEMVVRQPMPSMPVFFWNDPGNARYRASYFDSFPGVWRHGDWIEITGRGTVVISGRSDATLNRDGVRIGTSEVYGVVEGIPEVADSLVVCIERKDGSFHMPLFVVLREGAELDDALRDRIKRELRTRCSPRHVPDAIHRVEEVPYTISGKKMETPVKKILMGSEPSKAASLDTMRNPASLDDYVRFTDQ